jgi:Fur family ferric uptake transcriptional regulator
MRGVAEVIDLVRTEARRRGVRWTAQRQAIVESFIASADHLSVEEIHRRVRTRDTTVSAATIYRTLNLLVEIGIAARRQFGDGSAIFESTLDKSHHDHLVCLGCGAIREFHRAPIETLQEDVARESGFVLSHHRLDLFGWCSACQASGLAVPGAAAGS